MIGTKTLPSKSKRTEIMTNSFSKHSTIKFKLNIKKPTQKKTEKKKKKETHSKTHNYM